MKPSFNSGFEDQELQKERANQVAVAIKSGDAASAILAIDQYTTDGYDLNAPVYNDKKTFYDPTLLMVACAYGNQAVSEHLIAKGANPRRKNHDGLDAYVQAAMSGHLDIMQLLTQHGCDLKNAKQYKTMNSALYWAARYGHLEVVQYLEKQGVDLQGKGDEGYGLLHAAAESGNAQLIRYLLDKGFDPNAVGEGIRDVTPLMEAAGSSKNPEVVQILIDAGANVNQLDSFLRSALSYVGKKGSDEVKKILLRAGANPAKEGESGAFAFNVMSQDLGNDHISKNVKALADELLKHAYVAKPKEKEKDSE